MVGKQNNYLHQSYHPKDRIAGVYRDIATEEKLFPTSLPPVEIIFIESKIIVWCTTVVSAIVV